MTDCQLHYLPYHESPCDRFALIRKEPGAVLLDAGRPVATRGRFDLMSAWPDTNLSPLEMESAPKFIHRLREALASLGAASVPESAPVPFAGGLIGYLSYDFGRRLEQLPDESMDDIRLPDAQLGIYTWALISDHELRTSQLVFHPSVPHSKREKLIRLFSGPLDPCVCQFSLEAPFAPDIDGASYRNAIDQIHAYIEAGDCYQVNFTQRFRAPFKGDPWVAYLDLRSACPTPFAGYVALPCGGAILSLSPERFLEVSEGFVETRPIKGTRPRGHTPAEDECLAVELLTSEKDRAENLMIVDLLRNDIGRSCAIGSVRVPELFTLESYPNVHHLVSSVTGRLAAGKDALDLITGSFPGGSITGAPKIRAMEIIDELEPTRRSIYCGSLLYLDVRGEMDSSIAIRSLVLKDGQANCWGGGGIVADSTWQEEHRESITKVKVLLNTLEARLQ